MRHATRGRPARTTTAPRTRGTTSERFVALAEQLAAEVDGLRQRIDDDEATIAGLTAEMAQGLSILEGAVRGSARPSARLAARTAQASASNGHASRQPRVTPAHIGPDLVRETLQRLGRPLTAAELAAELSRGGQKVSGRAVRHIAKAAGAQIEVGEDGRQLYSLA
jgi:hypothetical protein